MGEKEEKPEPSQSSKGSGKPLWLDILDVSSKVATAAFLLLVAWIGNRFQAKLTGISLQSQREQAESQLRANMFNTLIGPIVGPTKDGNKLSADREELLVELLALNFHDDFELKPLMEDVDRRLSHEPSSPGSQVAQDPRRALWSIARRVAARQIASIQWQWSAGGSDGMKLSAGGESGNPGCQVYTVTFYKDLLPDANGTGGRCTSDVRFTDVVPMRSPNGAYKLQLVADNPDWTNQTVHLNVDAYPREAAEITEPNATYPFTLTWFDFPLTDNTLLPDGNRFAVNLQLVTSGIQGLPSNMKIRIIWFPRGYFTPRERPFDFMQVRKLLGLPKQ